MCVQFQDIGKNKENKICLANDESISGRCERRNTAAKCEIFVSCSENFIGICKTKQNKTNITAR